MSLPRLRLFNVVVAVITIGCAAAQPGTPYRDVSLMTNARVRDLLTRMTPEEKFRQLFMVPGDLGGGPSRSTAGVFGLQVDAGAQGDAGGQLLTYGTDRDARRTLDKINDIQRWFIEETHLGIPMLAFDEALHGLVRKGATAFPQSIGMAASWDTTLMSQVAAAIALETKARGIRMVLSPVVNLATDPRWGRVEETYGEDPLLSSCFGVAYVKAMESRGIITTPKHFVGNHGDGGRDSYPVFHGERLLRESYFKPFKAAIQLGGARSIMTAYNSLDGRPCSANSWLLKDVLRKDWGFRGFVISDAAATGGANVLHFTARDYEDAGKQSVENGQDVIFQTDIAHTDLFKKPYLDGTASKAAIDSAVAHVLRMKFELGLFDKPYMSDSLLKALNMKAHRELAYEMAVKGAVLLKNANKALPFPSAAKRILVIGPDADEARLGGYSGPGNEVVSILDGLKQRLKGKAEVTHIMGYPRTERSHTTVGAHVLHHMEDEKLKPGLSGTYFNGIDITAKPAFTRIDDRIDFNWTLFGPDKRIAYDHFAVKWEGVLVPDSTGRWRIGIEGNEGYRLYLNDSLVIDRWSGQGYGTSLIDRSFSQDSSIAIRLEYRERAGNARFKLIWDKKVFHDDFEYNIFELVEQANAHDAVIVVAGIEEGEFRDRSNLKLPGHQERLIAHLTAEGEHVIVVLVGGSAITMDKWIDDVDAVLMAWYPGEAGGLAIADLLLGTRNPSGKLPITFPRNEGQLPLIYNHYPTGRGDDYVDGTGQPLFPFGFGLSYSSFEYTDLQLHRTTFTSKDTVLLSFKLTNTSTVAGDEVVQLYTHDELASIARPVKELKGFQRVSLQPGEAKTVFFKLHASMFAFPNEEMVEVTEPGAFRLMVGGSSKDIRLRTMLEYVR